MVGKHNDDTRFANALLIVAAGALHGAGYTLTDINTSVLYGENEHFMPAYIGIESNSGTRFIFTLERRLSD